MPEGKGYKYEGHDEATQKPSNTHGLNFKTPQASVPLAESPTSVNVKSPSGHKGGENSKSGY